jgi:hypothetical protein
MLRLTHIEILNSHSILCVFNSEERRILDVPRVLDTDNPYVKKLLHPSVFVQAKLGSFGEILWEGVAEIRELDGTVSACAYDISPEFVYYHSDPYIEKA